MREPRFEVWLPLQQEMYQFFTLIGARQWLANEKAEGRPVGGAAIRDKETGEYLPHVTDLL